MRVCKTKKQRLFVDDGFKEMSSRKKKITYRDSCHEGRYKAFVKVYAATLGPFEPHLALSLSPHCAAAYDWNSEKWSNTKAAAYHIVKKHIDNCAFKEWCKWPLWI